MPGLGTTSSKYQISVGWRYAEADRSYFDSKINRSFTNSWRPFERLSVLDVTGRYSLSKRTSLTASLPIVFNNFSMLFPPLGPGNGVRHGWGARGIGDVTLFSQTWLLDGKKHPFHNVALGVGMKLPTGNWNAKATIPNETGQFPTRRAVYPAAIMPGDGGVGMLVGFDSYKVLMRPLWLSNTTLFASGSYLINARNTNGIPSMITNLGVPLTTNFANSLSTSVADAYNMQLGVAFRLPGTWDKPNLKGLRFRIIGRCEGVTDRDLIGGNKGFRQPGYAMSVGPGFAYARGKDLWLVEVPIVFNQHINPGATLLPGLPRNTPFGPQPGNINFQRQMGLVAPLSISLRYVRSI